MFQATEGPASPENGWATLKSILPYIWPRNNIGFRMRVVLALMSLALAKVATVLVPFVYKAVVDGLDAGEGDLFLLAAPIFLVVAYGMARVLRSAFEQARDAIFTRVGQRAIRQPFATTGTNGLAEWRYAIDNLVNARGGVLGDQMEIVAFDNKISPKESLIQLQVAIDQGIRFIAQGNSSGVANALTDAIRKHNKRNPGDRVLFINYSAVDPALTNDKCNFWHFRFDANADIKMDALTDVMNDFREMPWFNGTVTRNLSRPRNPRPRNPKASKSLSAMPSWISSAPKEVRSLVNGSKPAAVRPISRP